MPYVITLYWSKCVGHGGRLNFGTNTLIGHAYVILLRYTVLYRFNFGRKDYCYTILPRYCTTLHSTVLSYIALVCRFNCGPKDSGRCMSKGTGSCQTHKGPGTLLKDRVMLPKGYHSQHHTILTLPCTILHYTTLHMLYYIPCTIYYILYYTLYARYSSQHTLLGFRWDSEDTPQLWLHCADVAIRPGVANESLVAPLAFE